MADNRTVAQAIAAVAGGEEAILQLAPEQHPWLGEPGLNDCLAICGITTNAKRNAFKESGYSTMVDYRLLTMRSLSNMEKGHQVRQNNSKISVASFQKLKGLLKWVKQRHSMDLPLDSRLFTREIMMDLSEDIAAEDARREAGDEPEVEKPPKFKPDNWPKWCRQAREYL